MRIAVQNLQKKESLATQLVEEHRPDLLLVQEVNLFSETQLDPDRLVHFTSRRGYGTAIYSGGERLTDVRRVQSPHAEFGGFFVKKTVLATCADSELDVVSFHGYNGQPRKDLGKLLDHVRAVLEELKSGRCCVIAGDFNTWTQGHVDAVRRCLSEAGFSLAYSWPYPGRAVPLDHVFLRGCRLVSASDYECASDHRGAIIEIELESDSI